MNKTVKPRPKRNLAGTFAYPVLVVFHEKHGREYWTVESDEEFAALCIKTIEERARYNWYSSIEEAEKGVAKAEAKLVIERQGLASAEASANDLGIELDSWTITEFSRRVETAEKYLKDYREMRAKALHVDRVVNNVNDGNARESAILLCQMEGARIDSDSYGRMEIVQPMSADQLVK